MRRMLACLFIGVFCAVAPWTIPPAPAQPAVKDTAEQQQAAEFARLYERWQQSQDPEQQIALAEQALKLEPALKLWPLQAPRARVKGELLFGLGDAYDTRRQGDRADNLEQAIAHYEAALTVRTREAVPQDWAQTHNNLANAYRSRIRGDSADNLEKAIAHLGEALTVRTREAFPQQWASSRNNLAIAYGQRIRGDRADNLEQAIAHLEATLTVRTREAFPLDWASTQNVLAIVYGLRIHGERAGNRERAIAHYEAALTVRTREAFPQQWADTRNNLAIAYHDRIRGERADNLEQAIAHLEAALTVRTREAFPLDWAQTQNNLANAYRDRIRGERADNLEQAIVHLEAALTVRTREAFPQDWAQTQNNLANAYRNRIRGERAANLEQAIAHYEAALTVRTREAFPQQWADTQNNLAITYRDRIRGDRAANLEQAIAHSEAALTVRTRAAFPQDWAQTQNNLANAYRDRIRGERAANLEQAIGHYEQALTVLTRDAFPRDHLRIARLQGGALLEAQQWHKAGLAYATAREAFLLLFGQGVEEAGARDLITQAGLLFAEAAFAAVQRGETEAALELAGEGKARLMAVALKLQTLALSPEQHQRLHELRVAIRAEERVEQATQGIERATALTKLAALRQELLALVKGASAAERRPGSALAHARALVAAGGAVLVPVLTKVGAKILIATAGKDAITILDLPELTTDRLDVLIRGEHRDGKTGGWLGAYNINYLQGLELDQRWPDWIAAISDLGPALWRLGGERLHAALKARGVGPGTRLVWLPTGALGILPMGLAQDPANQRRFLDDYEIIYAPSLEALAAAQDLIRTTTQSSLVAIINPTGDLPGTEKEGAVVASHFATDARTLLQAKAAMPDAVLAALKGRTHWHFASHGAFSWEDARRSALVMHGRERLTVGQLLETDGLGRPRLVVLSACETGLYDIDRNPDEFIGLPGAFAALGAAGTLSTLWPVSDDATALLMARFYELHMRSGLAPPTALARAQAWLREATNEDLYDYAQVAAAQGRLESRHLAEIQTALSAEGLARSRNRALVEWVARAAKPATGDAKPEPGKTGPAALKPLARPYAHPYFWAGFIHMGL